MNRARSRFREATVVLLGIWSAINACATRRELPPEDPPPPSSAITTLDNLPGEACGTPLMVLARFNNSDQTFCIDRFEASIDGARLGNAHQAGGDDTSSTTDGTTEAVATVDLGVTAATGLTWYQAKAACENAGKRLCSQAEWEQACRGLSAFVYPYGDTYDETACRGFFYDTDAAPAVTGSLHTCGSVFGVYDMSGNLEEWVDGLAERVPGSGIFNDRAVRGGSFRSNREALRCVGSEFRAAPGTSADNRGFRCCSN